MLGGCPGPAAPAPVCLVAGGGVELEWAGCTRPYATQPQGRQAAVCQIEIVQIDARHSAVL